MTMATLPWKLGIGASVENGGKTTFRVWASKAREVSVRLWTSHSVREEHLYHEGRGYFAGAVEGALVGDRYIYVLDNTLERPDPASRFQPDGVHGPSVIVDPGAFAWTDGGWSGTDLTRYVIYELHVGAFTATGTFEAVIPHLDYLKEFGVTAIELMPVAQFPGTRNWGYDAVYPYAPQNSYGGPTALRRLIDVAHSRGFSIILDVVYNHLGPEGNYLNDFGHYFTDRYKTPWGPAINFDGPYSDQVRNYFLSNACYWVSEFHIDALRLDAIHGIFDFSARHFLLELSETIHGLGNQLGRNVYLIAESDLDDVRVINPVSLGGYGIDAQWNDDFHHSLHTLLTGERTGYYQDFGRTEQMVKAIQEGFVYTGEYSPYRKRPHGSSSGKRPARQFVHFSQNHDQIGNRPLGDRPGGGHRIERLKLAAAVVVLTPGIPLLFMGEEYGETAPFTYFVDHSDPTLKEAVRIGRAEEFAFLGQTGDPPDPFNEETFLSSKIDISLYTQPGHREIYSFYREMLRLRGLTESLWKPTRSNLDARVMDGGHVVMMKRGFKGEAWLALFNFSATESWVSVSFMSEGWQKILDSSSTSWGGPGEQAPILIHGLRKDVTLTGYSAVLYKRISPRDRITEKP